jgi:hypothetical protein
LGANGASNFDQPAHSIKHLPALNDRRRQWIESEMRLLLSRHKFRSPNTKTIVVPRRAMLNGTDTAPNGPSIGRLPSPAANAANHKKAVCVISVVIDSRQQIIAA